MTDVEREIVDELKNRFPPPTWKEHTYDCFEGTWVAECWLAIPTGSTHHFLRGRRCQVNGASPGELLAAVRSLPAPSPQPADAEQPVEERESMKRLREVAGDRVADACKRGIDKAMEQIRADEQADEKDRRIYYQNIVYEVCELLDAVYTPSTCCGIVTAPTTQVQDRVRSLIKYRDQQSEKYQAQLATLTEQLREAEELVEGVLGWDKIDPAWYAKYATYRAKHEKG